MSQLKELLDDYENRGKKREENFEKIKTGLQNSIGEINTTLKSINNWDELFSLNTEDDFDIDNKEYDKYMYPKKNKAKSTLYREYVDFYSFWSYNCGRCSDSKRCSFFLLICGFFFCLIQLIGVQLGIIILNALFNEIVDEFQYLAGEESLKKEYNFYEKIEIASYKSIPEVDVGMFWSFIGIIVLKKYGFGWSNIFQFLSSIGFLLFIFFLIFV